MNSKSGIGWMILMFAASLSICGCVKRGEKVTVFRDGRVSIEIEVEGKQDELDRGDALPAAEQGWKISTETRHDEHEGELKVVNAQQSFAANQPLPRTFAQPGNAESDIYSEFPTSVTIEERNDGTYYHFHRRYVPRPYRYLDYWSDECIDDDVKKLGETPVEQLTREQKMKILKSFADLESARLVEMARSVLLQCEPALAQDHWLLARKASLEVYEAIDWDFVLSIYDDPSSEARDERFARESRRYQYDALRALRNSLRETAHLPDTRLNDFDRFMRREQRKFELTGELGGQFFGVAVTLPGEPVAHNANEFDKGAFVWEFDGEAFRDRTFELMATSRIARGQ